MSALRYGTIMSRSSAIALLFALAACSSDKGPPFSNPTPSDAAADGGQPGCFFVNLQGACFNDKPNGVRCLNLTPDTNRCVQAPVTLSAPPGYVDWCCD